MAVSSSDEICPTFDAMSVLIASRALLRRAGTCWTGKIAWEFYLVSKKPGDPERGPQALGSAPADTWKNVAGVEITGGATWTSDSPDPTNWVVADILRIKDGTRLQTIQRRSPETSHDGPAWRKTSIRNEAINCSPGATTRRPSPEQSAFVAAVIGSMAMNSLSFGAKIWAKGKPLLNSMAME
jgi:hypothetical protein